MALDRKTGAIKWQAPTDAAVLGQCVAHAGKLYCPVRSGHVIALNLADGKPLWKTPVSGKSPVLAGLALAEGQQTLFAVAKDGTLALLNPATGAIIGKHPLNKADKPGDKGLTLSTPTLADDHVFVGSETGGLQAFQVAKPQ